MLTAEDAIDELIRKPPALHISERGAQQWSLGDRALRWLAAHVQEEWRTLETGCGHSSIVFALKRADHTIVAPVAAEHERVRRWCEDRGFATDRVTSVVELSQKALPRLSPDPLDLAVIDGAHGFPAPFIDWYYIAERLRPGGYLIVDDTQLLPCRLLGEFLLAEAGRWQLVEQLGPTTALFRKLSDEPVIGYYDWRGQPWVVADFERALERERSSWMRLRRVLRPRTRLRRAAARLGLSS